MADENDNVNQQPLSLVVGEPLSAVVFIQDYVQLQFNDSGLTLLTWPTVVVQDRGFEYGDPQYRDMLCERINKIVRTASLIEGQEIRIEFEDNSCVLVSLRPESYQAAEAAIFTSGPDKTWVW